MDSFLIARPRLHSMQRGKKSVHPVYNGFHKLTLLDILLRFRGSYVHILYCFQDIAKLWLKIPIFKDPPVFNVSSVEISRRGNLLFKKNDASMGEKCDDRARTEHHTAQLVGAAM